VSGFWTSLAIEKMVFLASVMDRVFSGFIVGCVNSFMYIITYVNEFCKKNIVYVIIQDGFLILRKCKEFLSVL